MNLGTSPNTDKKVSLEESVGELYKKLIEMSKMPCKFNTTIITKLTPAQKIMVEKLIKGSLERVKDIQSFADEFLLSPELASIFDK